MRIYTDHNGVAVNAITEIADRDFQDSVNVEGHRYDIIAGSGSLAVMFQHGPVKEQGVNGPTNEAFLVMLIHRTEYLNKQFPCEENEVAIEHMKAALASFESRTAKRLARGVEGQNIA